MHLPGSIDPCNLRRGDRPDDDTIWRRLGLGAFCREVCGDVLQPEKDNDMLRLLRIGAPLVAVVALAGLLAGPANAASAEQEKAFVDAYKQAYEASDGEALKALLYTEGADPMALEFYAEMMTADFGGTITDISLRDLTADEVKQAAEPMDGPSGGKFVLAPKPYKKLVVAITKKDANGQSKGTSESFVAENGGKLVISTPAPAP